MGERHVVTFTSERSEPSDDWKAATTLSVDRRSTSKEALPESDYCEWPEWADGLGKKANKDEIGVEVNVHRDLSGTLSDFLQVDRPTGRAKPRRVLHRLVYTPEPEPVPIIPPEPEEELGPSKRGRVTVSRKTTLAKMSCGQWSLKTHDTLHTQLKSNRYEGTRFVPRVYPMSDAGRVALGLDLKKNTYDVDVFSDGTSEQESEERTPRAIEMEQDGRFMCEHYLEEKPELLRKAGLLPHYDTSPWIDDFLPKTRTEALSLIHGASERENIIRGKEHAQYLLATDAKKNVRKASGTSDELASKLTK
jgi:hypothetical protein